MLRVLILLLFILLPFASSEAALVERLMGLPGFDKIEVHEFYALNNERINNRQTRQNVIDALGLVGGDITEYDALVALAPSGSTALAEAQKSMYLNSIHSILMLAEIRVAGYSTATEVRGKLGL